MDVIREEHDPQGDLPPLSRPGPGASWAELLIDAALVGAIFLVLAMIVVASGGQ